MHRSRYCCLIFHFYWRIILQFFYLKNLDHKNYYLLAYLMDFAANFALESRCIHWWKSAKWMASNIFGLGLQWTNWECRVNSYIFPKKLIFKTSMQCEISFKHLERANLSQKIQNLMQLWNCWLVSLRFVKLGDPSQGYHSRN